MSVRDLYRLGFNNNQVDFLITNPETKSKLIQKGWLPEKGNLTTHYQIKQQDGNFSQSIYYAPDLDFIEWKEYMLQLANINDWSYSSIFDFENFALQDYLDWYKHNIEREIDKILGGTY